MTEEDLVFPSPCFLFHFAINWSKHSRLKPYNNKLFENKQQQATRKL